MSTHRDSRRCRGTRAPRPRWRAAPLTLASLAALGACNSNSTDLPVQVTSGTITGVPFHVTAGTVYQASPDGPIHADSAGATVVLDESPSALGMTDPESLHLRTHFALSNHGSLQIAAYGPEGDEIDGGLSVLLDRVGGQIGYGFLLSDSGGAPVADSSFDPPPDDASRELWVATEFYAQSVPGYGPGAGITLWPPTLDETAPASGGDVLGCTAGPLMQSTTYGGDRVAYSLHSAFITGVDVVDDVVGPCPPP